MCNAVPSVVFVLDGHPDATPHEIGHVEGLGYAPTDECTFLPSGALVDGYWPDGKTEIDALNMMGGAHFEPGELWIAHNDYEHIFENYLTDATDPTVLLVNGTVDKDGNVNWSPFYSRAQGILDDPEPGPYSLRILDSEGQLLYEKSFQLNFRRTDPAQETNVAPFGLAISYPPNAADIQVALETKVLAHVNPTTKLLRDAVDSIPSSGFVENATQRRNALHDKIDALDRQLATRDQRGARNHLENDIRKTLEDWLVDGYSTQATLQYTKEGVLGLVDELLRRMTE